MKLLIKKIVKIANTISTEHLQGVSPESLHWEGDVGSYGVSQRQVENLYKI